MEPRKIAAIGLGFLLIGLFPVPGRAEDQYTYAPDPKTKVYFGHISFSEIQDDAFDPVVYRIGDPAPEKAVLNLPLGPGDIVQTSSQRRCEIQFDTGTIIRLDFDTRVQIETILADSLSTSKKVSNFILEKGRIYVMYKRYNRPEIFQVMTPKAAFKLAHNSVATLQSGKGLPSDAWVDQGKIYIRYGVDADKTRDRKLKKGERARIGPGHDLVPLDEESDPLFREWNSRMNADFIALHAEQSKLPKPILRYPSAVIYFAQRYSTVYGEWLFDDLLGYVWRPHMHNLYPYSPWRPMVFGQWREMGGQLFWVPEEAWGWVPYHLGLWHWDKNKGWLWIPGSAFAPAWAQWYSFFGRSLFGWNIWSLFGWCPEYLRYSSADYNYDPKFLPSGVVPPHPTSPEESLRKKKQWSQGGTFKTQPIYPLTGKMKSIVKRVRKALKKSDPKLLESISSAPQALNVVRGADLNAPGLSDKYISPSRIPEFRKDGFVPYRSGQDAAKAALRTHWTGRLQNLLRQQRQSFTRSDSRTFQFGTDPLQPSELETHEFRGMRSFDPENRPEGRGSTARPVPAAQPVSKMMSAPSAPRFRDWNPDTRAARRYNLPLSYNSALNRIESPQLASRSRAARRGLSRFTSGSGGGMMSTQPSSSAGPSYSGGSSSRGVSSGSGSSGSGRSSGSRK
jgi:hypothetical protein